MKKIKRCIAIILSMVLGFSMSTVSFASERYNQNEIRRGKLHEKKVLGVISFCVNNSIAVDWIRISWSNKVYFFDNYISSNCFICNIIAKIAKVICE